MDWADIARVVLRGGREFLHQAIEKKQLLRASHGLTLARVKGLATAERGSPRIAKCTFHDGASGCTIAPELRPATCNYYVCNDVFDAALKEGHRSEATAAQRAHDALVEQFIAWDAALLEFVSTHYPDGPAYDDAFFDALTLEFQRISGCPSTGAAD